MSIKHHKPITPGRRFYIKAVDDDLANPHIREKSLRKALKGPKGRSKGTISVRHQARGAKKFLSIVDFKRDKTGILARVAAITYDPTRSANVALLFYKDGEKRYIIAPRGLKVDEFVSSGPEAEIKTGNFLPLKNMPLGSLVHNIELVPGQGGIIARGAGTSARLLSLDGGFANVELPSKEVRKINEKCGATFGEVGNADHKNRSLGKAGRKRHLGIRPSVRGVAMHPNAHPHGGGEGRSGIGMPGPKTPWGKPTLGKKTRVRKRTNRFIVKDRRIK